MISSYFVKAKVFFKGLAISLFLVLVMIARHFKSKSERLEDELDAANTRNSQNQNQINTYISEEQKANQAIKDAKANSYLNRDHFE